jgi:peptide deformylase
MIREIVTYDINRKDNNEILHKKLKTVSDFKAKETLDCIKDLNDTLDDIIAKQGNRRGAIGLSANQIDYDLAVSAVTLKDKRYIFCNPEVLEENGKERLFRIGCFSVDDYRALVRYNDDVVIGYEDENGKKQTIALKGDQSCVVQHEMDHLQGMLLFEKAEDISKDFFIPRETVYKDGNVPLKNHGWLFELRRRLGLNKAMITPAYYSSLFNDYTDYCAFVQKEAAEKKELLEMIMKHTPDKGKILETGATTSALSVALNQKGYDTYCLENDPDMYDLAIAVNEQNKTEVRYAQGELSKLPYPDRYFDTVFSYQELESYEEEKLSKVLAEGLQKADRYIFMVPTIKVVSNALKGNEILRSEGTWKKLIRKNSLKIVDEKSIGNGGFLILVIGK